MRNAQCFYITGGMPFDVTPRYGLKLVVHASFLVSCNKVLVARTGLGDRAGTVHCDSSFSTPSTGINRSGWTLRAPATCVLFKRLCNARIPSRAARIVLQMYNTAVVYFSEKWLCSSN